MTLTEFRNQVRDLYDKVIVVGDPDKVEVVIDFSFTLGENVQYKVEEVGLSFMPSTGKRLIIVPNKKESS